MTRLEPSLLPLAFMGFCGPALAFVGLRWPVLAFVLSQGSVRVSGTLIHRLLLLLRACIDFGGLSGACMGLEWPNRVSTMVLGRNAWCWLEMRPRGRE